MSAKTSRPWWYLVAFLSALVSIAAMWIGAYFMQGDAYTKWWDFPCFMTCLFCFIAGTVGVIVSFGKACGNL